MELFQHEPSTSRDHFRVIDVFPAASEKDILSVRVREVRFDATPAYSAISYTWDDQLPTIWVVCNNSFFAITRNCADILRGCRKTDTITTAWVDQICIDQTSTADKNHHVSRMDDIYEKATEVLVWIPNLGEDCTMLLRGYGSNDPSSVHNNIGMWHDTSHVVQEAMRRGVKLLESKTWFRRMWTVQEAVIARPEKVYALFKGERIPLLILPDFMTGTYELWLLAAMQELVRMEPETGAPLSDALRLTLGRQCKDPRDKVFALHGVFRRSIKNRKRKVIFESPEELERQQQLFAKPIKMWRINDTEIGTKTEDGTITTFKLEPRRYSPPPSPDYNKSVVDVYVDTTWWFLQQREWHILFIGAMSDSERSGTKPTAVLPSWVPDFTRMSGLQRPNHQPWQIHFTNIYSKFAEPTRSAFPDWPLYDPENQSLDIVGHILDTVSFTSEEIPGIDTTPRPSDDHDRIERLRELYESEYCNEHDRYFKEVLYIIFSFIGRIRQQNGSVVSVTTVARVIRFQDEQTAYILQLCEEFLHLVGWDCNSADAQQQLYELPLGEAVQSLLLTNPNRLPKYDQWAGYEKEDRYNMWIDTIEDISSIARHTLFYTEDGRIGISLGTPRVSDSLVAVDVLHPTHFLILRSAEDFGESYWRLVSGAAIDDVRGGAGESTGHIDEDTRCRNLENSNYVCLKIV